MFIKKLIGNPAKLSVCIILLLITMQCANKSASVSGLPDNILGIELGMNKEDAENRLKEIGKFSRQEEKRQELWSLKDNSHFGYIALGYDRENQVRYVAAIANPKGGKLMRFDEIGDLSKAKKEVVGQFHRYVWEVPAKNETSQYSVTVYGQDKEFLSNFIIAKPQNEEEEEE